MLNRHVHEKHTQGYGLHLLLPKVGTEAGREKFNFQGALILNGLPADLQKNLVSLILNKSY